ncbi:MAG: hypothetical protein K2N30_02275 [Clostridia bacterium]|nr:hypothetical protein [Clostridia bacterium]
MKKIIFSNLPMKKELYKLKYTVDGNDTIEYGGEVIFPVNAVLARTMKKGDKIKVVLLSKVDVEGNSAINAGIFQKELNSINRDIGADIEYITLATPFEETRGVHETLLRDMVDKIESDAEIIGDVTYGPKPLPIIMFAVMNFAEKFFSAKIKYIVYGKVDFVDDGSGTGKTKPVNPVLYDLTPLYYLNSVTNAMEYKTSDEAVKALDVLLDL